MVEDGIATEAEVAAAKAEPLAAAPPRGGRDRQRRPISPRRCGASCSPATARRRSTRAGSSVRTSLDARLQAAADKALRAGLINYDRGHGGWRGAVGHIDPGAANWAAQLAARTAAGRRRDGRLAARGGAAHRARTARRSGCKDGADRAHPVRPDALGAAAARRRHARRRRRAAPPMSSSRAISCWSSRSRGSAKPAAPQATRRSRQPGEPRRSTISARSRKSPARWSRSTRIPAASWR